MRRFIKIGIALLLMGAVGATVYLWRTRPIEVLTQTPHLGVAVQAVYATGVVEPTVSVPIAPRVAGRLMELHVDEGDRVRKGQLLARLEDNNLRSSVEQLAAQERWTKQAYERALMLLQRGVGTSAERDKALADWQAAQAATRGAKDQQAFMRLYAPSDGIVLRRDGEVGQLIAINQILLQLASTVVPRITAEVDEEDIAQVKSGQAVIIRADAFPDQLINGTVSDITPAGDPTTRSYRVRIALPGDSPLRVGMTVDTNIILERRDNALLIPLSALVENKGDSMTNSTQTSTTVWVLRNGRLEVQAIKIGIRGEREVQITEGLSTSDQVIITSLPGFKVGQRAIAHAH